MRPQYFHESSKDELTTVSEIFDDQVYLPSWFEIKPDEIKRVIDVGALIGSFTLWACEQWPNAIIHSYEPDPESYKILIKNIQYSKNEKRVTAFNLAVWSKEEVLELHRFQNTPGCNSVIFQNQPFAEKYQESISVHSRRMLDVIKEIGDSIDFLKIDCEGSEYDLLYSLNKSELQKIKYIALEYHEFNKTAKQNAIDLSEFLRGMGFTTQIIPTDVRPNKCLGYIYASSSVGKKHNLLNSIFDITTDRIYKNLEHVEKINQRLVQLQKEFQERSEWALALEEANKKRITSITELQKEFDERSEWAIRLNNELKQRDEFISKIQKEFDERSEWAIRLNNELKQRDEFISKIQKEFDERSEWAIRLNNELKQRDEFISKIQKEFDERSEWAIRLNNELKQRDEFISKIQKEFDERSEWAIRLNNELKQRDELIIKLEKELVEKLNLFKNLETTIITKESQIKELQSNVYKLTQDLDEIRMSILFQILAKISRFLDRVFPAYTKRGEGLRLLRVSLIIIKREGFKIYFGAVKEKLRKYSFLKNNLHCTKRKNQQNSAKQMIESRQKESSQFAIISSKGNHSTDHNLRKWLKFQASDIINLNEFPLVSIIVPTFNQVAFLERNLQSIETKTTYKNYEIIIVTNNLEKDSEMAKFLSNVTHRICYFTDKYSFAAVNNFAAKIAKGDYLLFLNDDVEIVSPNWLEALLHLALQERVGAVGAKLIFPDGKLQEAGCIVWKNGSAWNYGRGSNPDDPIFNYVREVDYCSASCLLVKRNIFHKIGGFDLRYTPAYAEDVDLCFAIMKEGYRIMYQPLASVIHYEGRTQGTDVTTGIKSYQIENQKKFFKKWESYLQNRIDDSNENTLLGRNRRNGLNILYIDHYVPEYDKDSGSIDAFYVLSILARMGHKITFWPDNLHKNEPYVTELQQRGIEVIYGPHNFDKFLVERRNYFQICFLARPHIAPKYIDKIREKIPNCKIIYETTDLHFIREQREAQVKNDTIRLAQAEQTKKTELDLFRKSDVIVVKSEEESKVICQEKINSMIAIIPPFRITSEKTVPYEKRKNLLFLGGFQHPPNVDALEYLLNEIYPKIKEQMTDIKLKVVGSNPSEKIKTLCTSRKDVEFYGYVKDVEPFLENCRILVAPLRFGAGVKGKIIQSMCYGLPVVTTSIGSEGISSDDGKIMYIAKTTQEFVSKTIKLYTDKELWNTTSDLAKKLIENEFSPESVRDTLSKIVFT